MSRMYNQSGNLYSGIFDCLKKTVKTEGVLAIYKGYFAHLARILPHTVSFPPAYGFPQPELAWLKETQGSPALQSAKL